MKLVLPGGSGFIGNLLADYFCRRGWEVVVLSRANGLPKSASARTVCWDGRTLGPWTKELEGAEAVVNLAGRSVNCRYHERNRRLMMDSRMNATRVIGQAVAQCCKPPRVWINASTATIYKHSYDRPMDETSGVIEATPEAKDAFSVEVATAWERVFAEAKTPGTRKVALRSAMVLGADRDGNNVYAVLRRLVRLGLGGKMCPMRR